MYNNILRFSLIGAFALFISSCGNDDDALSGEDQGFNLKMNIEWELDWEKNSENNLSDNWGEYGLENDYDFFRPRKPEGVAVFLYNGTPEAYSFGRELHLPAAGGSFSIDYSTRAILFVNDDSDYVILNNLGSPYTVTATTGQHPNSSFNDLHKGEKSAKQPDILYGALIELTDEQISTGNIPEKVVLEPLAFSYVIRYDIGKNREHVLSATGALAGMAESVNLGDKSTSDSKSTYIFDSQLTQSGIVMQVMTFGVPSMEENSGSKANPDYSGQHDMRIALKLANGKTWTIDHDVTDQIAGQRKGGIITIANVDIPDDVVKGNSGFDTDVDDWDNSNDIPLL